MSRKDTAKSIWKTLKDNGFSDESAAGILGNIEQENSEFNPGSSGMGNAYGIFQFDPPTKFEAYCKEHNLKKDVVSSQVKYMLAGLGSAFSNYSGNSNWWDYSRGGIVKSKPSHDSWAWWGEQKYTLDEFKNITGGVNKAALCADIFCRVYERASIPRIENRQKYAIAWLKEFAGVPGDGTSSVDSSGTQSLVLDLGHQIVRTAREQVGKPAHQKGDDYYGPDSFNTPGLIYYSYSASDVKIPKKSSADKLYEALSKDSEVKKVTKISDIRAADLLFYKENGKISRVALATGKGGLIRSNGTMIDAEYKLDPKPDIILRVLKDNQTAKDESSAGDVDYVAPKIYELYNSNIKDALSSYKSGEQEYGYLIETKTNKKFKFYIPEFTESAGTNWNAISIMGRSVTMYSYESTNSRSVTISLELYAGEGLYKKSNLSTSVEAVHSDANFVKSLEYPDYTSSIVRPPSQVLLILGSNFKMLGVVSGVSVDHLKPLDSKSRSMYIKLSFTVTQVAANPPDYKDIRNGKLNLI